MVKLPPVTGSVAVVTNVVLLLTPTVVEALGVAVTDGDGDGETVGDAVTLGLTEGDAVAVGQVHGLYRLTSVWPAGGGHVPEEDWDSAAMAVGA